MKTLAVVAFLDGRPGHEKQTKGVLRALSERAPIDVEYRKLQPYSWWTILKDWGTYLFSKILPCCTNKCDRNANRTDPRRSTPSTISGYRMPQIRERGVSAIADLCEHADDKGDAVSCNRLPVDLIIGTGTRTHIPMLLLKKECGAATKAVTCMTPNPLLVKDFDLCLVPQHDNITPAGNIFLTVGPPSTAATTPRHDPGKKLILVGGVDKKSHVWNTEKVLSQIRSIIAKEPDMLWTISSSPRTPAETLDSLQTFAGSQKNISFFRAEETPAGWIEEQYAVHSFVWVTADSISMVYEALTAGCAVGILPVEWKRKKSKFQRSLHSLTENNLVVPYEQWLTGEKRMPVGKPLDEASRCAGEILQRWWPKQLQ